jgi:glucose-1-phosphate cytidylyltransferase
MNVHKKDAEPWNVTLIDTGESTLTGGRLKKVSEYLKDEDAFCFTYGDGVSDIDISKTIEFHQSHGKLATVSAVLPPGRYGALNLDGNQVMGFTEKPLGDGGVINGGFFVLSPQVLDLIDGDQTAWEGDPLSRLAKNNELMAFRHEGFWQPMDTLRDKNQLEDLWSSGQASWKTWK